MWSYGREFDVLPSGRRKVSKGKDMKNEVWQNHNNMFLPAEGMRVNTSSNNCQN